MKEPQQRLGFKRGATEVKQHPFFEGVNWALIRCATPPEIPKPVELEESGPVNVAESPSSQKTAAGLVLNAEKGSDKYLEFDFF